AITGMQFVAIATIVNLTLGLSMIKGILVGWILLTLKTYFGGLKAVIWQDALHGTIQTVGIATLFVIVFIAVGNWGDLSVKAKLSDGSNMLNVFNISIGEIFVYVLTIGGYQFVRQDLWQRFWAAKDIKTATKGYWTSIILSFVIGAFVIMIGVLGNVGLNLKNINPTLVYYEVIGSLLPFPMIIVMIIALLATVISTADSFFIAGASSIVNDIIKPKVKKVTNKKMLLYSRLSVAIVSIIVLLLALYIPQLVSLWVAGTAMLVSGLLAPVLFGLFWKRATKEAGVLSMWTGLIVAVIWQIAGHPLGLHPVFIGLPLSIFVLVIVSLFVTSNKSFNLLKKMDRSVGDEVDHLYVNMKRLKNTIDISSQIGTTSNGGLCRLALSKEDREMQDTFLEWLKEEGLVTRVDDFGNIYGRRRGKKKLSPVLIGSHLDTQPRGGRFDGILGVLASLEVIRTLNDHGIETERPIEIVNFTNE